MRGRSGTSHEPEERTEESCGDPVPPPGMHPHQLLLPLVSYVLAVAVFWSLRGVNVVADLVKEDPTEKAGPHQWEAERPFGDILEGLIDENLDPSRLSIRRVMIEPGSLSRVSELLAAVPAPLASSRARQSDRVRKDDSSKGRQLTGGHRIEEFQKRWPHIAGRPVLSVCFDNLNHGQGAYRQRHEGSERGVYDRLKLTAAAVAGLAAERLSLTQCSTDRGVVESADLR